MKLMNVLLATKQTALELYRQNYDDPKDVLPLDLLEEKKRENDEHYASFALIKGVLEKRKIPYQRIYMPYGAYEEFVGRDLVISIGGDGTVLNAAHYILDDTPILTVKSEGDSTGALCKLNAKNFEEALEKMIHDDCKIEQWSRVEGRFGHKKDIALNEISISRLYNGTASYSIKINDLSERQRSSKLLVSTGAGSTAWYHNVEHQQGKVSPLSKDLLFVTSEDIRDQNYKMTHGIIHPDEEIEITSLMDMDGIIQFDGDKDKRLYKFPIGQKIYAKLSDKPLSVVIPRI